MADKDKIRLQRFMAQAGVASRRKCEQLISAGQVKVNGKVVVELGTRVDPRNDKVYYAGLRVMAQQHVWLVMNKPVKTVCTASDPEGRQTVLDLLGYQQTRIYPVGRLDYHTQGVLLLTNDGDLAAALAHPRNALPRVYHVKLRGIADPDDLDRLREGVRLDTGETVKALVHIMGSTGQHTWIQMTLTQGLNHQIHRMVDAIGGTVLKLIRVSFGPLDADGLRPGKYRNLTQAEIKALRTAVNLGPQKAQRVEGSKRRGRGPGPRKAAGKKTPARKAPARKAPGRKAPGRKAAAKPFRPGEGATAKPRKPRKPRDGAKKKVRKPSEGGGAMESTKNKKGAGNRAPRPLAKKKAPRRSKG